MNCVTTQLVAGVCLVTEQEVLLAVKTDGHFRGMRPIMASGLMAWRADDVINAMGGVEEAKANAADQRNYADNLMREAREYEATVLPLIAAMRAAGATTASEVLTFVDDDGGANG